MEKNESTPAEKTKRVWEGKTGTYIKSSGSGRKGKTESYSKHKAKK